MAKNKVAPFFGHGVVQAKCNFTPKTAVLHFSSPPLVGLGATYDDYLRLIGKRA